MSTRRHIQEWVSKKLAFFVAIGVASLSVILWQALIEHENSQVMLTVEQEAINLRTEIRELLEPTIDSLVRMGKRWGVQGGTPREEWEADAALFITHHIGQRGIAWVDSSYILQWSLQAEGRSSPGGGNAASDMRRRIALEAARERREVQVTRAVELTGSSKGFLVYVPLFVDERFDGYIASIFRIQELLDPLLSETALLGYAIAIFDGEEKIASRSNTHELDDPEWLQETAVEIRNVTWRVQVWPGPELVAKMRSSLPEVALVAGLLLALLMSLTVRLAQKARLREQEVVETNKELEEQITERKRVEEALRFTQFASDRSPVAVYWMDSEGRFTYVNDAASRASGYSRQELLSMTVHDINPDYSPATWPEVWKKRKEYGSHTFETRHRTKDGRTVPVEITANYLEFHGKEYNCSLVQDITERKQAEEALRETQKMKAVGTLAGGVAHEFNNLLTGILGYSELLLKKRGGDPFLSKQISEIKKAGEQAASLASQLLAFSRKQVLQPQVLDLNEIVTELNETLHGLMGEDIVMMTALSPELGRTKADAAQMKQMILNLASNARSAMPRGGKFILATENAELSEDDERGNADGHAVRHVLLTVSDTGSGMNAETLSHVFEPFFTTKEVGTGTGLGLASVYGIVQQSGGRIKVSSEPGRGTKFQIYLPRVDKPASPPKRAATTRRRRSGGAKTVLLVEDTIQVRQMVCLFLQRAGYTVLEASNGAEALQIAQQSRQPIHMLLTDVIMPEMNGPDLAARLTEDLTDIKVLYMSGYSNHPVVQESVLKSGASFIAKPFTPDTLLQKVREVFDTPAKVSSQMKPRRVQT